MKKSLLFDCISHTDISHLTFIKRAVRIKSKNMNIAQKVSFVFRSLSSFSEIKYFPDNVEIFVLAYNINYFVSDRLAIFRAKILVSCKYCSTKVIVTLSSIIIFVLVGCSLPLLLTHDLSWHDIH